MKQQKFWAIVFLVVVFALFFMTRPTREKACPLTKKMNGDDPDFNKKCADQGGVVKDGICTCPE